MQQQVYRTQQIHKSLQMQQPNRKVKKLNRIADETSEGCFSIDKTYLRSNKMQYGDESSFP